MSSHSDAGTNLVASDFREALLDLKINSRPEISNLTIIAKENTEHAQAISKELENHIKTARPEWKLPALYVLDSIVKNVGTPYTVYLGRNLYRTFMDAYTLMTPAFRKAMEGLLRTWKQPVPESMDPRPVFPPEVTRDIENALSKFQSIAAQHQPLPARPPAMQPMQHGMPARPMQNTPWRSTPTPPQNGTQYMAANDPRVRHMQPPQQQQQPYQGQYSASATPPNELISHIPQAMSSVDLEGLKGELSKLITTTKTAWALSPQDPDVQTKLKALIDLEQLLRTQTLPPAQLEMVRTRIRTMTPPPLNLPGYGPLGVPPPPIRSPQQHVPASFPAAPPPMNAPLNLAQLLASANPPLPPATTPTPIAPTPSLADILRGASASVQPPASVPPPFTPSFAAPPIPPPASTPNPTANLASLLAQFSKPAATPPIPQAPPLIPALALGSADWLLNALQGLPKTGTPSNTQPMKVASEPMTRQPSGMVNSQPFVELTTASMKQPRLNLISRLYEAIPNICVTCGRRFEGTPQGREKKARHMDWHFKVKDPDAAKRGIHRSWYISEKEWIEYREIDETAPEQPANGASSRTAAPKKEAKDKYVPVPTDPTLVHMPCPICQEKFQATWNVEANDFVWMDAVKVNSKIYHATCWEEYSKGASIVQPSTPDSVLGKRKAEVSDMGSGKKVRAY
ncbi:hypothetical protein P154DRAFT_296244 [Amniculicola lignicola CBS 123094]|uniref:CID domain-containing protein n=1 Tax=Amniculicola lignicola CBS 123094 TaxID=1392246 RepID=A0A6A5WAN8_9PLEO|nr:hypothetical protein P154DRAFT_296244 [Amniculicola lignicola CBS 123094]